MEFNIEPVAETTLRRFTVTVDWGELQITLDSDENYNYLDILNDLVIPASLGAGFHPDTVGRYVNVDHLIEGDE